ncbi:MAG: TIR domain-containing protein [Steroidobacteraceae bacterium]
MTESAKAVFLSYASQDAPAARHVCDALRSAGVEVWFDQSELRGGDAWDRQIRKHIHDCALFVPVISSTTQARLEGYFRREWKLAVDRTHDMADGKPFIVPVVIDDTNDQEAEVPESFRAVQWTRLPEGRTPPAFVERVLRLLSPSQARAPPHSRPSTGPAATIPANAAARASRRSQPAVLLIAAVAVIAAGYVAIDKWVLTKHVAETRPVPVPAVQSAAGQGTIPEKSIAVLPFVDMSEKKDQEYFSDGLSEELIDHLAHSADLKVIARTSSFQFKGRNEDVRTIAEKLGVANLLEGSVRTSGHAVRITAQLIRAADGTHLWSQSYDRQMSDIFKVQDEIAATVVEALKATLTPGAADSAGKEQNIDAYNLLLKGNFIYERSHPGDYDLAIEQYRQALKLDPNYALAWAKLARVYIVRGYSSPKYSQQEQEATAREALRRALSLDPDLAVAHRWLGRIYLNFRWDWPAAKRELERAIALDPNGAEGNLAYDDLLIMTALTTGRFEDIIRQLSHELTRNPLDTSTLFAMGWILIDAGQLKEAAAVQHRLLELDPAYIGAHANAATTALLMGKFADALAEAQGEADEVSRLPILALVYWALERKTDADLALRQLERQFAGVDAYEIGEVHAYRGETDAALTWLERAYRQHEAGMVALKVDPLLRNLHGLRRYQALQDKMKISD